MSTEILGDQESNTVHAHSSATTAKGFYVINGRVCLAQNDADADADNVFTYEANKVRVPKATGEAWAFGEKVYYDVANGEFNKSATGNTLAGIAIEAAESADTEGVIHLTPATLA